MRVVSFGLGIRRTPSDSVVTAAYCLYRINKKKQKGNREKQSKSRQVPPRNARHKLPKISDNAQ